MAVQWEKCGFLGRVLHAHPARLAGFREEAMSAVRLQEPEDGCGPAGDLDDTGTGADDGRLCRKRGSARTYEGWNSAQRAGGGGRRKKLATGQIMHERCSLVRAVQGDRKSTRLNSSQ